MHSVRKLFFLFETALSSGTRWRCSFGLHSLWRRHDILTAGDASYLAEPGCLWSRFLAQCWAPESYVAVREREIMKAAITLLLNVKCSRAWLKSIKRQVIIPTRQPASQWWDPGLFGTSSWCGLSSSLISVSPDLHQVHHFIFKITKLWWMFVLIKVVLKNHLI